MIVRFHIDQFEAGRFDYRVTHEGEDLYADAGLASIEECISAAIDGLGQDALGAEIAYKNEECDQRHLPAGLAGLDECANCTARRELDRGH